MKTRILMVLLAISVASCDTSRAQQPTKAEPASSRVVIAPLATHAQRGVCLAHNWQDGGQRGYGTAASDEVLAHLKSVGVTSISVTPFGFMSGLTETVVQGEHTGDSPFASETAERLLALNMQAQARGLDVILKPHIWIAGGKWRGHLQPKIGGKLSWDAWWKSYTAFMLYYAALAQKMNAKVLVIGVELASATAADPKPLIELAHLVRKVYAGRVTYAANWNEPVPDAVWLAMDSVGVQFYGPISHDKADPELDVLRAGVRQNLAPWRAVAKRVDRPLVLTEVGYRAANSAARYPSAWPETTSAYWSKYAPKLQEKAYQALFLELAKVPELGGVFVWKYFTDAKTTEEGPDGFSPRSKLAERVMAQAYR